MTRTTPDGPAAPGDGLADAVPAHDLPPELPTMPPDGIGVPGDPLSDEQTRQLHRLAPGSLPLPRWFGVLAAVCAVGLVPWIIYLALNLPHQQRAAHYDVAWVGFDLAMLAALALLAVFTVKRSTWTEPMAVFTGTLLLVDAWFDVVTSSTRREFVMAVLSAGLVEVPLAVLCLWLAHSTEVMRRRAYRLLWRAVRVRGPERRG